MQNRKMGSLIPFITALLAAIVELLKYLSRPLTKNPDKVPDANKTKEALERAKSRANKTKDLPQDSESQTKKAILKGKD